MNEQRILLDGIWDFQVDSGGGLDAPRLRPWRSAVYFDWGHRGMQSMRVWIPQTAVS